MCNTDIHVVLRMEFCIYTLDLKNTDIELDSCINDCFYVLMRNINNKIGIDHYNGWLYKNFTF